MAMAKKLRILPIELDSSIMKGVLGWIELKTIIMNMLFLLMVNH